MASMRAAAAHVQEVLREVPAGAKTSPGCLQAQGKHLMETPRNHWEHEGHDFKDVFVLRGPSRR